MYEAFIDQTQKMIMTSLSRFAKNYIDILLIVHDIFVSGTFAGSINHFLLLMICSNSDTILHQYRPLPLFQRTWLYVTLKAWKSISIYQTF